MILYYNLIYSKFKKLRNKSEQNTFLIFNFSFLIDAHFPTFTAKIFSAFVSASYCAHTSPLPSIKP
jgi:hypothetical protein